MWQYRGVALCGISVACVWHLHDTYFWFLVYILRFLNLFYWQIWTAKQLCELLTEKYFRNLIKSNRNQILCGTCVRPTAAWGTPKALRLKLGFLYYAFIRLIKYALGTPFGKVSCSWFARKASMRKDFFSRNLVKSNRNQIVFTILLLIRNTSGRVRLYFKSNGK